MTARRTLQERRQERDLWQNAAAAAVSLLCGIGVMASGGRNLVFLVIGAALTVMGLSFTVSMGKAWKIIKNTYELKGRMK